MTNESEFLRHIPCEACGSSDGNSLYNDGHTYCFVCETWKPGDGQEDKLITEAPTNNNLIQHDIRPLKKRGINVETCQKLRYGIGDYQGQPVHVADYCDERGHVVAQKVRFPDKNFVMLGEPKKAGLWCQHLWKDGGRKVIVTEGEIDCLTVSQLQGNKWPVVSLPSGAAGAKRSVQRSIEWLEKFDEVVFCFDNDDPGRKAAEQSALLMSPGKAKVVTLPLKDASDMMVGGKSKELMDAIWQAKTFRPDGIVPGDELWEILTTKDDVVSAPYPFEGMNDKTGGIRKRELVTFTAGTGIGKSAFCREIAHHLLTLGHKVGYIALEESVKRTAQGILSIDLNIPVHRCDDVDEQKMQEAFKKTLGSGRCFLYDHFGSIDCDSLLSRIKYMAVGLGVDFVILDHLSIVVSGLDGGDERRTIDQAMTRLRSLVEQTGIGMVLVSHLRRPDGRAHEEGGQTSLSQLRGSAGIAQLSDMVVGLERDQQGEHPNVTTVRILKNRWSGDTGEACHVQYDKDSGRLAETHSDFADTPSSGGFDDVPF